MSYPLDLDEISEENLRGELKRREQHWQAGLCDYCGRKPETPPCKFPDRHQPRERVR